MKKKSENYWDIKPRKIVVILFEETKEFFINDTAEENLWKYYDNHDRGRVAKTRTLFALYKQKNQRPPIFHICTVNGTIGDTFIRKMEVVKYFTDHGYTSLVKGELLASVEEYTDWDKSEFYLSIKDIQVEVMCAPEKNLFPNFKNNKPQRTENCRLREDEFRIELRVKKDEYEKYKNLAQKYGVPMTDYILECARNGGLIQVDTFFLEEYIHKIDNCHDLCKGLLVAFLMSGNYYPSDIVKMQKIKDEIGKSNSSVQATMVNFYRSLRRLKRGATTTGDQLE